MSKWILFSPLIIIFLVYFNVCNFIVSLGKCTCLFTHFIILFISTFEKSSVRFFSLMPLKYYCINSELFFFVSYVFWNASQFLTLKSMFTLFWELCFLCCHQLPMKINAVYNCMTTERVNTWFLSLLRLPWQRTTNWVSQTTGIYYFTVWGL